MSEHLGDLLEHAAEHYERPLPPYVIAELEGYLTCGQFEQGFVRCRCDACGFDLFVPFSCGSRSICPSCAARRMSNTAAHLVDRVLPNVPIRQWVLSLPFELRPLALARPEVVSALGRIFVETVFGELRRSTGLPHAQCGAVSFLHRAGDSFNANPHWHVQQLDGLFFRDGPAGESGPIRFLPAPPPEPEQLERIATKVRQRSVRWLARRGFIDERAYEERSNERLESTALEACTEVSLRAGCFATIDDHGVLAPRGIATPLEPRHPGRVPPPRHPLVRYFGVLSSRSRWRSQVVPQPSPQPVRPATSQPRALGDGRDRTAERAADHRRHRHESDAAASASRHPTPRPWSTASCAAPTEAAASQDSSARSTKVAMGALLVAANGAAMAVEMIDGFNVITARHWERLADGELLANGSRLDWARLMRRTLAIDPLRCPRCDARLRPIAEITEPEVIARILEHLADQAPRAPPQNRQRAAAPPPPSLH